jgi:hypothetical protein
MVLNKNGGNMKTMKSNIISLFLITGLFFTFQNTYSQNVKLDRQERKEVRQAQRAANFYVLDSLLNARSFVLVADYLKNQYGDMVPVSSMINFIRIDGPTGVIQTGSNFSRGYNGVGGVTAEGSIGNWEVFRDAKRFSHRVRFSILSNIGHYDVSMVVSSDNRASATVSGMWRGRLTWDGHLETVGNSRVFKGQNTI